MFLIWTSVEISQRLSLSFNNFAPYSRKEIKKEKGNFYNELLPVGNHGQPKSVSNFPKVTSGVILNEELHFLWYF